MLDTLTDRRTRLEQARAELIENEGALAALGEAKAKASKAGREVFSTWKDEFEWRTVEKERLTLLVETLERELLHDLGDEAKTAFRERYDSRQAANKELAKRVSRELAEINVKALTLVQDMAAAAIEDAELNAALPADLEPLVSANVLARADTGRPREEINSKRVWLWVRADNGALIGDPDAIQELSGDRGIIHRPPPLPAIRCRKALFEQISFHPAEAPRRANPFWQIRLLDADGPGVKFDGTDLSHPREVLAAISRVRHVGEPQPRPIETEIRPVRLPSS